MATSAQGLTFTFGGTTLKVTSVQVNDTQDLIDASHLGIPPNARREFVGGFATDREVTIDYISNTILAAGASGSLSIAGPLTFSGTATCASASIGGSVGALVSGNATFRVA
jgi:hexokinase